MVQKLVCERSLPSRGENSSKPPSCVPQYSPRVPSRGLPRGLPPRGRAEAPRSVWSARRAAGGSRPPPRRSAAAGAGCAMAAAAAVATVTAAAAAAAAAILARPGRPPSEPVAAGSGFEIWARGSIRVRAWGVEVGLEAQVRSGALG
eukprot:scaffold104039_cov61-Phaeocystis_antarctica.AAC.6